MNINTVDLNLFLVFQAIYSTRSVPLAGRRLGMTQSAASNALVASAVTTININ